jgi:hypothetical protein
MHARQHQSLKYFLREERLILAHGFSPWSAGSIALELTQSENIMAVGAEAVHPQAARKQRQLTEISVCASSPICLHNTSSFAHPGLGNQVGPEMACFGSVFNG